MHTNRFDFLRLVFAGTVFVYHLVVLAELDPTGDWEAALARLAELAIQGFFVISGALVFGSWERSGSVGDYAGKRVRRLYPAYAVIIFLPALIALALGGPFGEIADYVAANLVLANFLAPTLPGLFDGQRFEAVNGALWTLKIEVMFYIALIVLGPMLVWLRRRNAGWLIAALLALYIAGEVWRTVFEHMALTEGRGLWAMIARQLPGQLAFFVSGISLWLWRSWVRANLKRVWRLSVLLLLMSFALPFAEVLRPAGLGGGRGGPRLGTGAGHPGGALWRCVLWAVHLPLSDRAGADCRRHVRDPSSTWHGAQRGAGRTGEFCSVVSGRAAGAQTRQPLSPRRFYSAGSF